MTTVLKGWAIEGGREVSVTLNKMRNLVRDGARDQFIIDAARLLTHNTDERDYKAQAQIIRGYIKDRLRFVRDPNGVELLQLPRQLLADIQHRSYTMGDCDDAATLSATLLTAIGFPCRFEAVAFFSPHSPFSHVYTVCELGHGKELDMDTTRPDGLRTLVPSRKHITRI